MNICKQLIVKYDGINTQVKSFEEALKLDKGLLYLEKCLNPFPFGFIYNDSFKSALIGDLSKGLDWSDYWQAYDEII